MRSATKARVVCTFEAVDVGVETGGAYSVLLVASENVNSAVRAVGIHMTADEAEGLADRLKELAAHVRSENKRIAEYTKQRALAVKCGAWGYLPGYEHAARGISKSG